MMRLGILWKGRSLHLSQVVSRSEDRRRQLIAKRIKKVAKHPILLLFISVAVFSKVTNHQTGLDTPTLGLQLFQKPWDNYRCNQVAHNPKLRPISVLLNILPDQMLHMFSIQYRPRVFPFDYFGKCGNIGSNGKAKISGRRY